MALEDNLPEDAVKALEGITSEETTEDNTPANDESSVSEPTGNEQEPEVSEGASEEEPSNWWDDSELAHGQSYGLSEEDVQSFGSKDDFRRATRLLDKQLGQRINQAQEPSQQPQSAPVQEESKFEFKRVELDPENYDEAIVNLANRLQDQTEEYAKKLDSMQQRFAAQEQAALAAEHSRRVEQFDSWVDSLGQEELFGKSGEMSNLQQESRAKLWEQSHELERQAPILGQNISWSQGLIERTANLAFYNEIERQRQASSGAKVVAQSKKRLGGGQATKEPPSLPLDDPAQDPEILEAYRAMVNENGTGY